MEIKKAKRHAVPMIVSLSGVSGSGKTYSGLLLAAGLVKPNGKIGFIDTENGRGCMYADSPGIMRAIPQGYDTIELGPPYSPERYIEAVDTFEKAGYEVVVIDSGSHEWSGQGGCTDIAEANNGRWNKAKLANKRFVNRLLLSSMHIVVCLRAQEKSKIIPKTESKTGKEEIISLGILPISEKSFPFEMLLSFFMEEKTNLATAIKCPEPLADLFKTPRMLTKADGERIREWNSTGKAVDVNDQLIKRSRIIASEGEAPYKAFFEALSKEQRAALKSVHEENKLIAKSASSVPVFGSKESPTEWPDSFDGEECIWNGERLRRNEHGNYSAVEPARKE